MDAANHKLVRKSALLAPFLCTLAVTLFSRLAYWPPGLLGKDGPLYINSMNLDSTYNVPMPGNIGWVLLAKFFTLFADPVDSLVLTSIFVSLVGTSFLFLLCSLFLRPWMAAVTTMAASLSPLVWFHSVPALSYQTWIAVPPAIAYFAARYAAERRIWLLYAAAIATGLGTILRPDMVVFAGPLFGGFLILSRPPVLKGWVVCAGICLLCCLVWFTLTAWVLGGPRIYLERVQAQSDYIATYGVGHKGVIDGLARNCGKFGILLSWGAAFISLPALAGVCMMLREWRTRWRVLILGTLALSPSVGFACILFMGNAGLTLPLIVASFLLAAAWLEVKLAHHSRLGLLTMATIGLLGAAQFIFTPMLPATNQRNVIINALWFGYSGASIRRLYGYNPADFGIDSSVSNALRQMRNPEPIPYFPPGFQDP
jgi:hypothetical protein